MPSQGGPVKNGRPTTSPTSDTVPIRSSLAFLLTVNGLTLSSPGSHLSSHALGLGHQRWGLQPSVSPEAWGNAVSESQEEGSGRPRPLVDLP